MNRKKQRMLSKQLKEQEQQTNEKKVFTQDIFKINYLNTSKILYQQASNSSDVKVNNYLCYQEGNKLHKVTEIIYEDKLIRIEDIFQLELNSDAQNKKEFSQKKQNTQNHHSERVRIFTKDALKNGASLKRKDKKNIVKNIVKMFRAQLEKKGNSPIIQSSLEKLNNILDVQNFNNRLIKKIIEQNELNGLFLSFLVNDAGEQIKYSRIRDKVSHYQAIKLYIDLLQAGNQKQLQNKQSQMSMCNEKSRKLGSQDKAINSRSSNTQSTNNACVI